MRKNLRERKFEDYNLDVEKNMLVAPYCECGCGEKAYLHIRENDHITNAMEILLSEETCENCGIFAHSLDGEMYAVLKSPISNNGTLNYCKDEEDMNFFSILDDNSNFHTYGLLLEVEEGMWKVIEE